MNEIYYIDRHGKSEKRYPKNPNYYYINSHPQIRNTMSIDGENYLHPQNRTPPRLRLEPYPKKEIVPTKKHPGRFQRFDSGIGDLENSGSGEFPMQIPRSCSPRPFHYDYADYPSHQYEEVPIQTPSYSRDDSQLGRPTFNSSSDIPNEEENQSQSHSESSRKRVNPLYEAVCKTGLNQNDNQFKLPPNESIYKQFHCLRVAFTLVVAVVLLSLIAITTVILLNEPKENGNLLKEFQELKNKHMLLERKLEEIIQNQNNSDIAMRSLDNVIANKNEDIQDLFSYLNSSLLDFQTQLHNISKMTGPQGPPGVGDLSKCIYESRHNSGGQDVTSTIWAPLQNKLKNYIVMSATCSVYHGLSTQLREQNNQYQCKCYGHYPSGSMDKVCYIHLWLCPKKS
ncbi:uncharacterized protein LOC115217548 isoform X2 [Octopus sinensis]|uniref:Uncharacterized protein LOC115217548 isoform X2 n=1 Tax=Octopus sinensis TaxID=2607531 RepID=A0A6P7SZD1_9MOLL|nr:uncharacterized protein LOC115217548 isoform X2 [Octopus sinensis]